MTIYEIVCLAIILSIDAFLVSFSYGITNLKKRAQTALSISLGVSIFQGIMPLLGAFFVNLFLKFIKNYALYIAGIIFIILGIKLFIDANETHDKTEAKSCKIVDVSLKTVLILSLATSIDAFAAGSSIYLLKTNIYYSSLIIALITFLNSNIGFYIAEKLQKISPCWIGKLGGILLALIGIKVIITTFL